MAAGANCLLPAEMVEEILICLPVKSLLRFRCISKSWRSLISDHNFARRHYNRAAQPDSLAQKTLVLTNPEESGFYYERFDCFLVDSLPSLPTEVPDRRYCPCPFNGGSWLILSSYDGFMCVRVDASIFIWNPCLNTYSKITEAAARYSFIHDYFEFGYSSEMDDYMLFRLARDIVVCTFETEIYSMKSESWIKLENFPQDYDPLGTVFLNGSFHCLAIQVRNSTSISFALFRFNLSDNKYGEVSLPEECLTTPGLVEVVDVCVLRGMLCVLVSCDMCLVLWVMKDYCDCRSWTKVLHIAFELISDD